MVSRLVACTVVVLLLSPPSSAQTASGPSKPPQKRAQAAPAQTAARAVNADGEWQGTTSKGGSIAFVVQKGVVVMYRLTYSIPSQGCFLVPVVNGATDVTWSETSKYAPRVKGGTLEVHRSSTSGGVNAEPISHLRGSFSSASSYSGTLTLTAISPIGSKPCQAMVTASVKATKVAAGTLSSSLPAPSATVAMPPPGLDMVPPVPAAAAPDPYDGVWESKIPDGQVFRFAISNGKLESLTFDFSVDTKGCIEVARLQGTLRPEEPTYPYSPGSVTLQGELPLPSGGPSGIRYRLASYLGQRPKTEVTIQVAERIRTGLGSAEAFNRCSVLVRLDVPIERVKQ